MCRMTAPAAPEDRLLTPAEVSAKFGVGARAVTRWDEQGLFTEGTVVRTLGGHRRFKESEINRLLRKGGAA